MNINEAMAVLDDLCGKEGLFSVAWKIVRTRILNAATEAKQEAGQPQQPQLAICRYYRQTQLDFNMGNMLVDLCECAGKPASVR